MEDTTQSVGDSNEANVGDVSGSQQEQKEDNAFLALKEEKRKLAERLKALESEKNSLLNEKKAKEQEALKQQGEYKKLYESALKEKDSVLEKLSSIEKEKLMQKKASAFMKELGAPLKREEYWAHVDFDSIPVDDNGEPDSNVLKTKAAEFKDLYSDLIALPSSKRLPNDAASTSGVLTHDEWKKLSLEEKRKNYSRVKWN